MERHQNAIKAARQAEKRRKSNSSARGGVRTLVKQFETKLAALPKNKEEAKTLMTPILNSLQRTLMKAGSKKLISKQAASRQVSRLSKKLSNALSGAKA
jgi:small subunit ribosomal protein S20